MRIAIHHHISLCYGGGGEHFVLELATAMAKRGHDVSVFALPYKSRKCRISREQLFAKLEEAKITYVEKWRVKLSDFDVAYYLYAPLLIKLHENSAEKIAGFHTTVYRSSFPKEYIKSPIPIAIYLIWRLFGARELKRFAAVRLYDSLQLKMLGNALSDNIRVYIIPHPIDTRIFKMSCPKRDKFTVLYVGRPAPYKGFKDFLEIAQKLANSYDIDFIVVGSNIDSKYVKSLGYVSDKRRLACIYSSAHLLLMPQKVPTLGRAPLEALACGTPAVLTAPVGKPYTNIPGLFTVSNKAKLIEFILRMYRLWSENPSEYMKLCRDTSEYVRRNFDKDLVLSMYERMFKEVAGGYGVEN